jgi:ribose 5-phosphate isomerase B
MKRIAIGCDHGGYELKQFIIKCLNAEGFEFKDFGTFSTESVDYPDFIHHVAKAVIGGEFEKGVVICGSGQGANMTANKYPNVRSALLWDKEQTVLTRLHNDANIIALSGRFIDYELGVDLVRIFMISEFEGGRHQGRIDKMKILL